MRIVLQMSAKFPNNEVSFSLSRGHERVDYVLGIIGHAVAVVRCIRSAMLTLQDQTYT